MIFCAIVSANHCLHDAQCYEGALSWCVNAPWLVLSVGFVLAAGGHPLEEALQQLGCLRDPPRRSFALPVMIVRPFSNENAASAVIELLCIR